MQEDPRRPLRAVLCPLTEREIGAAISNMERWSGDLRPFRTEAQARTPRPDLVFSLNGAPSARVEAELRSAFDRLPEVRRSFAGVTVQFCDLPPEKDVYVKDATGFIPRYGYKSGPNWLFFESLKRMRKPDGFVFLMETDCRPLVDGWLERVVEEAERHSDAWVVGSLYKGAGPLGPALARHINGNALYNVGDDRCWAFLTRFWAWILDHIEDFRPKLAYDCAWEVFVNRPELQNGAHYDWNVVRDVSARMRHSDFVVNLGGSAEHRRHYIWRPEDILRRTPRAAIAHGPVEDGDEHVRGAFGVGAVQIEGDVAVDGCAMTATGSAETPIFERAFWLPRRPIRRRDRLLVDVAVTGGGRGSVMIEIKTPGRRRIRHFRVFGEDHPKHEAVRRLEFPVAESMMYALLILTFNLGPGASLTVSDMRVTLKERNRATSTPEDLFDEDDESAGEPAAMSPIG